MVCRPDLKDIPMAKTTDYTKVFENMMSSNVFDAMPANDFVKSATQLGAKMNKIALEAAVKNTELSFGWAKVTLDSMQKFADPAIEPAGLLKASADAVNAQMKSAPEYINKFADVAKTAQTQAVELMVETGKTVQGEAAAAMKKSA